MSVLRSFDDFCLHPIQLFSEVVGNDVVIIYHGVQKSVNEKIMTFSSNNAYVFLNPLANAIKNIPFLFLEEKNKICSHDCTYLFVMNFLFRLAQTKHFHGEENVLIEDFHFRTLVYFENVFQNEAMDSQFLSDFLNFFNFMNSIDGDEIHCIRLQVLLDVCVVGNEFLFKKRFVV